VSLTLSDLPKYSSSVARSIVGERGWVLTPTRMPYIPHPNRPADKESAGLKDLEEALKKLEHVSDVDINSPGNVVAVSFEGGRVEREEIERTVEEAGYEISRLSVRTTFGEE
jgi:copper chaperone CopZ